MTNSGCIDQQRSPIGRCSRRGLRSNRIARPRTVLNNHRDVLRTTDLIGQQSSQYVGSPASGGRNDYLNCFVLSEMT